MTTPQPTTSYREKHLDPLFERFILLYDVGALRRALGPKHDVPPPIHIPENKRDRLTEAWKDAESRFEARVVQLGTDVSMALARRLVVDEIAARDGWLRDRKAAGQEPPGQILIAIARMLRLMELLPLEDADSPLNVWAKWRGPAPWRSETGGA